MYKTGFIRSLTLFLLLGLSHPATPAITRRDLEKVRADVLRLVAMSKNQSFSNDDRTAVQKALADAVAHSRTNIQALYDLSKGLANECPAQPGQLAESVVITLYGSWRERALSTFIAPLYVLIGHCDPLVRIVATEWLHDNFSGDNVESALFPAESTPITPSWIDDLSNQTHSSRPTAMGKALARLVYNSEFDPDLDAHRAAKIAWSLIENELRQALSSNTAMRRRVARLWFNDVQDIQGYWARQRTTLRSFYEGLMIPGETTDTNKLDSTVSDMLDRARYGDRNHPPLPPCQDLLVVKKLLN